MGCCYLPCGSCIGSGAAELPGSRQDLLGRDLPGFGERSLALHLGIAVTSVEITAESPRGVWRRHRSRSRTPPGDLTASSSSRDQRHFAEPEPEPEPGEDLGVRSRFQGLTNHLVDQRPLDFNVFGGRSH